MMNVEMRETLEALKKKRKKYETVIIFYCIFAFILAVSGSVLRDDLLNKDTWVLYLIIFFGPLISLFISIIFPWKILANGRKLTFVLSERDLVKDAYNFLFKINPQVLEEKGFVYDYNQLFLNGVLLFERIEVSVSVYSFQLNYDIHWETFAYFYLCVFDSYKEALDEDRKIEKEHKQSLKVDADQMQNKLFYDIDTEPVDTMEENNSFYESNDTQTTKYSAYISLSEMFARVLDVDDCANCILIQYTHALLVDANKIVLGYCELKKEKVFELKNIEWKMNRLYYEDLLQWIHSDTYNSNIFKEWRNTDECRNE